MKKLFILLLVALFLPVIACGDPSPSSFLYGTWARIVEYDDMQLYLDLFHIFPDHRAYILSSWIDGTNIDTAPNMIGAWSFENGKFYLFYEDNHHRTFIPTGDYELKTDEQLPVLYKKIYPRGDI